MGTLAFVLSIVAFALAFSRHKQVSELTARIARLESALARGASTATPAPTPAMDTSRPEMAEPAAHNAATTTGAEAEAAPKPKPDQPSTASGPAPSSPPPSAPKRPAISLERLVGVHLPVWGGAIMLLIGSFFLVRMAASSGFFTPTLGILACAAAGLLMLAAAFLVRQFAIANHGQIGAALASAAIGTFYATAFMASALFELTSLETGFLLAAGTAIVALGLSWLFGRPVLVVGLIGAYLAPLLLLSPGPDGYLIHLYIGALLTAATLICAGRNWWGLLSLVIVLHGLWLVGCLIIAVLEPMQTVPFAHLMVFSAVLVWAASVVAGHPPAARLPLYLMLSLVLLLAPLGAAALMLSPVMLGAFVTLLVLSAAMSITSRDRRVLPVALGALSWLLLVLFWREPEPAARIVVSLAALVALGAPLLVLLMRGQEATRAALLLCITVSFTTITAMVDLDGWGGMRDQPVVWAMLSLLLAVLAAGAAALFSPRAPEAARARVGATFATAASGFVSLAIVAVVDPDFFALAAALQVLGLSLVQRRFPVLDLRPLAWVYAGLYAVLLLISTSIGDGIYAEPALAAYLPRSAPWDAEMPALLLPALAFLAAATALARTARDTLSRPLDAAAVFLGAAAISFLIVPTPQALAPVDTLYWSSIWLNPVVLIGLVALLAGRRIARPGLVGAGIALGALALAASLVFVGMPPYQLWPEWNVPGAPVFNLSVTGLMLPGLLALAFAFLLRTDGHDALKYLRWAAVIGGGFLVITGLLVDIRHLFHPELLQGPSGPIERYSYSGGLLVLAFAALAFGTRLDSQPLRLGSLAIMLVTVAKVFLFDVGGLEGLWRVASFIAMGVALLVTSWVYARFVFPRTALREEEAPQDAPA